MEKELKTPGFTKVKFTALCEASYDSELLVPDDIAANREEAFKYIRSHLDEAPILELNFNKDLDDPTEAVWEEDIHWDADEDKDDE